MKLVITDREPFAALNPLEVRAYLVDTGWSEARVLGGRGSFWRHPSDENCELPLPYDRSVGDFTDRMRDAVEVLAHVEERSPLGVLKDLEQAGQDVIRVRLVSSEIEDGSVPLEQGVELMEAARNAVYASAMAASAKHRKAYYYSRPPQTVSDFMEGVRLGQTERGSYVVAIETPVAPALREQTEQTPEPFGRKVTRTLASALQILLEAANRGNAKDIERSVSSGVSANLCSAVAGALRLSGSQGEVEIRVSWARTRRVSDSTPGRISFPSYLGGVISEAAGLLRSISEIEGFELEGTIYQLRQDTEAIILGLVDGRYRKVRLTFPPEFREDLFRSYRERSIVRCVGELRQTGKTSELLNARSFSIEETEEDDPAATET
jgi:hypothetical protein